MRKKIKLAAISLIAKKGLINLSRDELCALVGIPTGSIAHYLGYTYTEFIQRLHDEGHNISGDGERVVGRVNNNNIRRELIIVAALKLAKAGNYATLTRTQVATAAQVATGSISNYMGVDGNMPKVIMAEAVEREIIEIVAQGLAVGDQIAKGASREVKQKAAQLIANS